MIELRWVLRRVEGEEGAYQHVLQTRRPEGPRGEQWDGPWEDVPIEQEYDDGH